MRVLFHCWEYPPQGSGIGSYVFEMSRALRNAGHSTIIVTSSGDGLANEEETESGFVYRSYDQSEIGSTRVCDLVLTVAHSHNADLIEVPDHLGEGAPILKVKNRPPVLVKMHYNDALQTPRKAQIFYPWQNFTVWIACIRDRERIAREKYSMEHADILVASSKRILDEARVQGIRISGKAGVIPNPISSIHGWTNKEASVPTILLVGRIDVGKGIQYLRGILAHIAQRYPDVRLEIVGGDSYARWLGSLKDWLVRQLGGFGRNVHFLGQLGPKDIDQAYRRAWVVIVPSRWDTFPTVVLEAMVRGKAIVASPHGGMSEMLAGTDCPVVDPERDEFAMTVLSLLEKEDLRRLAGDSALKKSRVTYSPEKIAAQYISFVNSCL